MDFYQQYRQFSKEQLFEILLAADDSQPDALDAAWRILDEKKWIEEYHAYLAEKAKEVDTEEDILEKAEFYRKAVEFKEDNNYIRIRAVDATRLEGALIENGIDYYSEEKSPEFYFAPYPAMHFYFKEEDLLKADTLVKELGLSAGIYDDYAQLWKPHVKVYILAVVFIVMLLILFSIFR